MTSKLLVEVVQVVVQVVVDVGGAESGEMINSKLRYFFGLREPQVLYPDQSAHLPVPIIWIAICIIYINIKVFTSFRGPFKADLVLLVSTIYKNTSQESRCAIQR